MEFLEQVLPFQADILKIESFTDELRTMRHVFDMPQNIRNLSRQWLQSLHTQALQTQSNDIKSKELRERGNEAYKLKRLLVAATNYTKALYISSPQGEQLCLAYANRGQVLLDYGYFAQAYDDCVCALEYGYPEKLRHKILLRQAYCAYKMIKTRLLQQHLNELRQLELNASCTAKREQLEIELLQLSNKENPMNDRHITITNRTIVKKTEKGRCLKMKEDAIEQSLLFEETAYSFVAVGNNSNICGECLSTLFIPYPCKNCYSQVKYCSLACKFKDAKKHEYECMGYRMGTLYANVGIGHLALHTLIIGLPEVRSELYCDDPNLLWKSIKNISTTHSAYAQTINLKSNLNMIDLDDIKYYALVADLLMQYLRDYTSFLKDIKATSVNWQLFISAILLRHIGQFITNAHKINSLNSTSSDIEGQLLRCDIWSSKFHLKCGYLNEFSSISVMAAANFPHLSMANHSCSPSFQTAFNGNSVRTYALKNIKKSEEIFNSYTLDYRSSSKADRQDALKKYNFLCKCSICESSDPDNEYKKLHRYRCEHCSEIYIPQNVCLSLLFNPVDDLENVNKNKQSIEKSIYCSICKKKQHLIWYWTFLRLLHLSQLNKRNEEERENLLKYYFKLENWLPFYNNLIIQLGNMVVEHYFKLIRKGIPFKNNEYILLGNILENNLKKNSLSVGNLSLEYARQMTFLWDLVALGKYSCNRWHMDSMLRTCTLLQDEVKNIFFNYYEDYMNIFIKNT